MEPTWTERTDLTEQQKLEVMSRIRSHAGEGHGLARFEEGPLLFRVTCLCGGKIEYTWQPYQVAIHIKRGYWDPTPGTGKLWNGTPYRYAGQWVTVHHDYACRFDPTGCCCNR